MSEVQPVDDCGDWTVVEDGHNFLRMEVAVETSDGEQSGVIAAIWEFPGEPRARRRGTGRSRRSVQLLDIGHRIRATLGLVVISEAHEPVRQQSRLTSNRLENRVPPGRYGASLRVPGLVSGFPRLTISVVLSGHAVVGGGAVTRRASCERQVQTQSPDSGTTSQQCSPSSANIPAYLGFWGQIAPAPSCDSLNPWGQTSVGDRIDKPVSAIPKSDARPTGGVSA